MRYATRTFLFSFVPFGLLLMGSFWAIQHLVESTVRERLRVSLRETHRSVAKLHAKSDLQNSRFLSIVGESAPLKAGLQLMEAERSNLAARLTVEDQLREISESLRFDFMLVSRTDGTPVAGVMKIGNQFAGIDPSRIRPPQRGIFALDGRIYQVASTPINQAGENLGSLSIGEHFDFSEFNTPAVLTQGGNVLRSSIPGVATDEVEAAMLPCAAGKECEVSLHGATYLSMPMESVSFGDGYVLRTLQNVDSASRPVQAMLQRVFELTGAGALLAALVLSYWSSRSIVRPIAGVVSQLQASERTGVLPELRSKIAPIKEIQELAQSFNRAASAIRDAQDRLHSAYLAFAGSLASALDARDRYTAGHSRRVSDFSCALAKTLCLEAPEVENIRLGGLLHDIGKIGITDSVLQKPGKLTNEEIALVKQHPIIGRHILEGVEGFHSYLAAVELHHENWDGSGYPQGLRAEATPLAARIVHIADAYDAMTTDRPYRHGMSHEQAVFFIRENAGTQFDPNLVPLFIGLNELADIRRSSAEQLDAALEDMRQLAGAIERESDRQSIKPRLNVENS